MELCNESTTNKSKNYQDKILNVSMLNLIWGIPWKVYSDIPSETQSKKLPDIATDSSNAP